MFDIKGKKKSIDSLLREDDKTWGISLSNEIERLAKGIRYIVGNNAINFIQKDKVPKGDKIVYVNIVCYYRPFKKEKYRARLPLGSDVLNYDGNASSPDALLLETKLLINGVISDADSGAWFMGAYLKDFYCNHFWNN